MDTVRLWKSDLFLGEKIWWRSDHNAQRGGFMQTIIIKPEKSIVPPLVFGERIARVESSLNGLNDKLYSIGQWRTIFDAAEIGGNFFLKSASVNLGGMTATAASGSEMRTDATSASHTMFFPISGPPRNRSIVNDRRVDWNPGEVAAMAPPGRRIGVVAPARAIVAFDFEPERLHETMRVMAGPDSKFLPRCNFHEIQLQRLRVGGVAFDQVILGVCKAIESVCDQPEVIKMLGIDDVLYRVFAMMLAPAQYLTEPGKATVRSHSARNIESACHFVLSNLDAQFTLTDLERAASLSRRALQYGFFKKYAMSPMQWAREQRLEEARKRLIRPEPGDSVTNIALSLGFASVSLFSRYYLKRYGESPSKTLRGHGN